MDGGSLVLAARPVIDGLPLFAIFCQTIGYSDRRGYPIDLAQFVSLPSGDEQERRAVMAETCFVTNAGVRPSMPTTIAIRPTR